MINQGLYIDGLVDGDIMTSEQMINSEAQSKVKDQPEKRNAIRFYRYLWIDKIIPYEIHSSVHDIVSLIKDAFKFLSRNTCLKFVPRTTQTTWIKFIRRVGCWSYVGRRYKTGGPQEISLGDSCKLQPIVLHELMHALGFLHEHQRPDREKHVVVYWENIVSGRLVRYFEPYSADLVDSLGVDYDYHSTMHYFARDFSKNNKYTMTAIDDPLNNKLIGPNAWPWGLTARDIDKVNALYSCSPRIVGYSFDNADIAIDDISLLWGPCGNSSQINPLPHITSSLITTEDTCHFESGFDNWQNAKTDRQFDWVRHKGETPMDYTGPSGDHTSRTGYYAYISTLSPRTIGQRARLVSKTYSKQFQCMSFWYNMNGDDVWQLNVYKNSSKEVLVWSASKNKGDKWFHGIISLAGSQPYNIIIEGVRGHGEKGDIAIDDLVVGRQKCDISSRCFTFKYHMHGSDVRKLTVYREYLDSSKRIAIFTKTGNQGDKWKPAAVNVIQQTIAMNGTRMFRGKQLHRDRESPLYRFRSSQVFVGKLFAEYRIKHAAATDKRLTAMNEIIAGIRAVKMYAWEWNYRDIVKSLRSLQNLHTRAFSLVVSTSRWVGLYSDGICALFVTAVAVATVYLPIDSATAGFILAHVISIVRLTSKAMRHCSEVETQMVSVERVRTYTTLSAEPGYERQEKPPQDWPDQGALSLQGMSMVYLGGGACVLKDITFEVKPKEKVGIAGRTGAGKSSLVAALFRMPDPQGHVLIDGIDLGTLNVQAARRSMAVISQNPVLFSGTLKHNLDPFHRFTEEQIWIALTEVQMKTRVSKLDGLLEYRIGENGSGFSVGETQLLCLARALLQRCKIVVLDEATANVDYKTDQLVQQVIREKFGNCTVLTIAHRLNTIMDYDRVLVLDRGHVVEYDSPTILAANSDGVFAQLLKTSDMTVHTKSDD
ncbi:hypothetical protein QZH41_003972 [Actinostola sp. cb2023]|nr:hypothetical protein QZH41_003972 [Actinostola sp. cb2023]